jgi:ribonuclease D
LPARGAEALDFDLLPPQPQFMGNRLHLGDLPADYQAGPALAIDTETLGLNPHRDRLCLVQVSRGDGDADLVQIAPGKAQAPNLERLLADPKVLKLFHFARFDIAVLYQRLGVMATPVWCTKIASKLTRTYTDRHGLRDLVRELLGIEISKQQQSSDWGAPALTEAQLAYAASDVLHLHALKDKLEALLRRENRLDLAEACFDFLPTRARLDLAGWNGDVFSHE